MSEMGWYSSPYAPPGTSALSNRCTWIVYSHQPRTPGRVRQGKETYLSPRVDLRLDLLQDLILPLYAKREAPGTLRGGWDDHVQRDAVLCDEEGREPGVTTEEEVCFGVCHGDVWRPRYMNQRKGKNNGRRHAPFSVRVFRHWETCRSRSTCSTRGQPHCSNRLCIICLFPAFGGRFLLSTLPPTSPAPATSDEESRVHNPHS